MVIDLYSRPDLYDRVFAWRDPVAEVVALQAWWQRLGQGRLATVLDLGCGSAPHAPAFLAAGIAYHGIDRHRCMLAAARRRAPQADLRHGDILLGPFPGPVDCACCFLGSLTLGTAAGLDRHLRTLARVVRPGGLAIYDWCVLLDDPEDHEDEWQVSDDLGCLTVGYRMAWFSRRRQLVEEELRVRVADDPLPRRSFRAVARQLVLRPELFATAAAAGDDWELCGIWDDWNPERPLPQTCATRPLTVLRRRA